MSIILTKRNSIMDSVKIIKVNNDQDIALQSKIDAWVKEVKPEIKSTSITNDQHYMVIAITYKVTKD